MQVYDSEDAERYEWGAFAPTSTNLVPSAVTSKEACSTSLVINTPVRKFSLRKISST
jgi:hypothetical protein